MENLTELINRLSISDAMNVIGDRNINNDDQETTGEMNTQNQNEGQLENSRRTRTLTEKGYENHVLLLKDRRANRIGN